MQPPPIQPPKFQPPPIIQPNIPVMVWTCLTCGKDVGTGAAPPANCPHCGIKLVNGMGPPNANMPINPINPNPNPPAFNPPPVQNPPPGANANRTESRTGLIIGLIVGGILFACVVCAGIGVGIYYAVSSGGSSKKSSRSSRRRR
jgi:DNA-directed RNA polymerase subunit RPC12/RpoP